MIILYQSLSSIIKDYQAIELAASGRHLLPVDDDASGDLQQMGI